MRGTNNCEWLLLGFWRCVGKYCSVHNGRIAKGGGTVACIGCGLGVKTLLARCEDCGADCARVKQWRDRQYTFKEEFQRLNTIEN